MTARIDSHPDPDVHALQTVDSLARTLLLELSPVLLRAEQRQRDRELRAESRKGAKPTQIDTLPADDRKRA